MYCSKCGQPNDDSAKFCSKCGAPLANNNNQYQQPVYQQPVKTTDNSKLFNILSYIGILWLFGLLINPEKNKPEVKFHVGQGIILSIVGFGLNIVSSIVTSILTAVFRYSAIWFVSAILNSLIWIAVSGGLIALTIIGIINAAKGEQKPLPIIGGYAFYK